MPHPAAPCGGARPCGAVKTVPCERGGGQRPTGKEKKRRTANPCRGRFHIGPQTVEKADCFPAAERLPCLAGRGLDPAAPLGFQIMTVGTCFLNLRRCGGRNRPPYRATGNGSRRGNGWFPDTLRRPCNKLPQMSPPPHLPGYEADCCKRAVKIRQVCQIVQAAIDAPAAG